MAFLDDSKGFVYLVLKFIQLIFRQSSINEYYVSPLLCMVLFMSFDNEGWAILLIVVCHMIHCVRGYKSSPFRSSGYKNIQLICLIFVKVLIKIKRNSIDTLSKVLTCVLLYFGRSSS